MVITPDNPLFQEEGSERKTRGGGQDKFHYFVPRTDGAFSTSYNPAQLRGVQKDGRTLKDHLVQREVNRRGEAERQRRIDDHAIYDRSLPAQLANAKRWEENRPAKSLEQLRKERAERERKELQKRRDIDARRSVHEYFQGALGDQEEGGSRPETGSVSIASRRQQPASQNKSAYQPFGVGDENEDIYPALANDRTDRKTAKDLEEMLLKSGDPRARTAALAIREKVRTDPTSQPGARKRAVVAKSKPPTPQQERISGSSMWFMIGTGLFFDAFNAILALLDGGTVTGPIISSIAWGTFWFWLWLKNVNIAKEKDSIAWIVVSFIWGFIPGLNILPEITAGIIRLVVTVRLEDGKKLNRALEVGLKLKSGIETAKKLRDMKNGKDAEGRRANAPARPVGDGVRAPAPAYA